MAAVPSRPSEIECFPPVGVHGGAAHPAAVQTLGNTHGAQNAFCEPSLSCPWSAAMPPVMRHESLMPLRGPLPFPPLPSPVGLSGEPARRAGAAQDGRGGRGVPQGERRRHADPGQLPRQATATTTTAHPSRARPRYALTRTLLHPGAGRRARRRTQMVRRGAEAYAATLDGSLLARLGPYGRRAGRVRHACAGQALLSLSHPPPPLKAARHSRPNSVFKS